MMYRNAYNAMALSVKMEAYHKFSRKLNVRPTCLSGFENITYAANGMEQGLVTINLVAQPAHQHVHDVRLRVKTIIPDVLHDHRLGHHAAGLAHQVFEQGKLPRLQFNLLAAALHFAIQQI